MPRRDVSAALRQTCPRAIGDPGFTFTLNTANLRRGLHDLQVQVTDESSGTARSNVQTINVMTPPRRVRRIGTTILPIAGVVFVALLSPAGHRIRKSMALPSRVLALKAIGAYLAAALVTLLFAKFAFGEAVNLRTSIVDPTMWAGLLIPVGGWLTMGVRRGFYWQSIWIVFGGVMLAGVWYSFLPLHAGGDSSNLRSVIESGMPYPRWLVGTAVLNWLHTSVWEYPAVANHLPPSVTFPDGFAAVMATVSMAAGTVALLSQWPGRLAILFPTLVPVWLMFSAGYLEYYPFIACPLLATLMWLFDKPLKERSPNAVGLLAAALPLLYVGFAPLGVLIGCLTG